MLKVLIADDEEPVREAIIQMLNLYCPEAEIVGVAENIASTVKAIHELKPDVLLLDIEMKDGSGFDVLKKFPSPSFKIIFITAYQQYAVEAFRFSALDYLLKPLNPDLLVQAICKAADAIDRERAPLKISSFLHNIEHISKEQKRIILKTAEDIHLVNLKDVVYCEADKGYTSFFLADKTRIVVSHSLGEYEEMFAEYNFLRIHQSYLVNFDYIKRYEKGDGGKIILSNGTCLPVATRKKEQLLKLFAKL